MAATALKLPPGGDTDTTHFDFTSKIFQMPGAKFALCGQELRFFVTVGGLMASMTVNTLMEEFHIARDSADARLMTTGLKLLKRVHGGVDQFPSQCIVGLSHRLDEQDGGLSAAAVDEHRQFDVVEEELALLAVHL